jgi:hypothetical protein
VRKISARKWGGIDGWIGGWADGWMDGRRMYGWMMDG